MVIIDESLLDRFRRAGRCELCHEFCRRRVPHHILRRGVGGGGRLDHPWNLLSLGDGWPCPCHDRIHAGQISRDRQIATVGLREGQLPATILAELFRLTRLDRDGREPHERNVP